MLWRQIVQCIVTGLSQKQPENSVAVWSMTERESPSSLIHQSEEPRNSWPINKRGFLRNKAPILLPPLSSPSLQSFHNTTSSSSNLHLTLIKQRTRHYSDTVAITGIMDVLKKTSSIAPIPTILPGDTAEYQKAGDIGNRTLWVVFVIMLISSLAFYIMAFRVPVQKRMFHILTAFITTFAMISYFAMAVNDGVSYNKITITHSQKHFPDVHETVYREVYWARYVDWCLTTPLLLLDLCLLAGLGGAHILVAVVADIIMIMTGLFAAFTVESGPKWGWYAMACIAYLVVVYQLGYNGRGIVQNKDKKTATFFSAIAGFTLVLWTVYPIIWGIADGSRNINVDAEIVAYAVLDVLAKPVFGFWLLFTHDAMSQTTSIEGFWAHGLSKDGAIRVGDDDGDA